MRKRQPRVIQGFYNYEEGRKVSVSKEEYKIPSSLRIALQRYEEENFGKKKIVKEEEKIETEDIDQLLSRHRNEKFKLLDKQEEELKLFKEKQVKELERFREKQVKEYDELLLRHKKENQKFLESQKTDDKDYKKKVKLLKKSERWWK